MSFSLEKTTPILGWREWISLPDFAGTPIKAKVDTGARTSSVHADNVRFVRRPGKRMPFVYFDLHPLQRSNARVIHGRAILREMRKVRSSSGHTEERPVIFARIRIGIYEFETEITLTNRDIMGFRMLLGRQAIKGQFLINPGRSYLLGKKPRKKLKKKPK